MEIKISEISKSPYTHASIYLGDGKIGNAGGKRLSIDALDEVIAGDTCVGVFRSQAGFDEDRIDILRDSIGQLIANKTRYDFPFSMRMRSKGSTRLTLPSSMERYLQEMTSLPRASYKRGRIR